jgi:N-acetylglucosamine kinase-like BadF-type ATPase
MQLLIDSGGSKSDWMVKKNNDWMPVIRLQGFNPWQHPHERLLQIIQELLNQNPETVHASHIFYYGAGCGEELQKNNISNTFAEIFPKAKISVHSDLVAAAHALFVKESGIACILGTGSNSGLYDGTTICCSPPSLGYLLGDEGSGAYLGKTVAQNYFRKLMPADLSQKFAIDYPLSLGDFLKSVYKQNRNAAFLANFAHFAAQNENHPWIRNLVQEAFNGFIQYNIKYFTDYKHYKIGFVGAIAYQFQEILQEALNKEGLVASKILKSPADALMNYYDELFKNNL